MAEMLIEGHYEDHYALAVDRIEDSVLKEISRIRRLGGLPNFISLTLGQWEIKKPDIAAVALLSMSLAKAVGREEEAFVNCYFVFTTQELLEENFSPRN